jgi:hypothetical protein
LLVEKHEEEKRGSRKGMLEYNFGCMEKGVGALG